jgi:tripartite-type tricarboxylate transporter receptor subunit TctC
MLRLLIKYSRSSLLVLLLGGATWLAQAQSYPARSIQLVVPAPAGGGTDYAARLIATKLSESLGTNVVVENRGSAASNVGTAHVAKSAPDGYTLLMSITSFSTNPALFSNLTYDTIKDFEPISLIARAPLLLVVNPSVQANSVKDLIALAKSKPGQINFANAGSGATSHLASELFRKMADVNIVPINYRGSSQALTDLIGGQVQMYFVTVPAVLQHINSGRLRAVAVSSTKRIPELPNVPTVDESGLRGFDVVAWFGVFAPAGTPKPIIQKLNAELVKILNQPDTREKLNGHGLIAGGTSPEELGVLLRTEVASWTKLIKEAGIKAE